MNQLTITEDTTYNSTNFRATISAGIDTWQAIYSDLQILSSMLKFKISHNRLDDFFPDVHYISPQTPYTYQLSSQKNFLYHKHNLSLKKLIMT